MYACETSISVNNSTKASTLAAMKVEITSIKKRLLTSDWVAILPPRKIENTKRNGSIVSSIKISLKLFSTVILFLERGSLNNF